MTDEQIGQLFTVLSNRRKDDKNRLLIGVKKTELLESLEISQENLEEAFNKLDEKIYELGVQTAEYYYEGELWFCLVSRFISPNELDEEERSVIGVLISLIENRIKIENKDFVTIHDLNKVLVDGKYVSKYQLEKILKNLEFLGYIERAGRNSIKYSVRLILEYPQNKREKIYIEGQMLI